MPLMISELFAHERRMSNAYLALTRAKNEKFRELWTNVYVSLSKANESLDLVMLQQTE